MVAKRKAAAVVADPVLSSAGAPPQLPKKKKSPLFNQPQNFYAPPTISVMTKDELSSWRKEQRRKRNRESAAASRSKTKARIGELEGEVLKWKGLCDEMRQKMAGMERHMAALMRQCHENSQAQQQQTREVQRAAGSDRVVSQPNSPSRGTSPAPTAASAIQSDVPFFPSSVSTAVVPPRVVFPQLASSNPNTTAARPCFSSLSTSPQDRVQKPQGKTKPLTLEKKPKQMSSSIINGSSSIVTLVQDVAEAQEEEGPTRKKMQHIIPISRQA